MALLWACGPAAGRIGLRRRCACISVSDGPGASSAGVCGHHGALRHPWRLWLVLAVVGLPERDAVVALDHAAVGLLECDVVVLPRGAPVGTRYCCGWHRSPSPVGPCLRLRWAGWTSAGIWDHRWAVRHPWRQEAVLGRRGGAGADESSCVLALPSSALSASSARASAASSVSEPVPAGLFVVHVMPTLRLTPGGIGCGLRLTEGSMGSHRGLVSSRFIWGLRRGVQRTPSGAACGSCRAASGLIEGGTLGGLGGVSVGAASGLQQVQPGAHGGLHQGALRAGLSAVYVMPTPGLPVGPIRCGRRLTEGCIGSYRGRDFLWFMRGLRRGGT